MIDIPSIFANRIPSSEKLIKCDFTCVGDYFVRDFPILEGKYVTRVLVGKEGEVDFRVYESSTDEEYLLAHVYHSTGNFVGKIHEATEVILRTVASDCFYVDCFTSPQSKRLLRYIHDRYDVDPEFLWSAFPECAAIRIPGKKSWFGAIMRISRAKLGAESNDVVEILNVKAKPVDVKARIEARHALPAYHMNKRHWCTVVLDEAVTDEHLMDWVDQSYSLVNK